jgi:NAD(P)H-nitrite reductase large subunit
MRLKHVIIGNSSGAVGCVEGIRRVSRTDEIVLIASEPHHTYGRPLISYLLEGKTDLRRIQYRPEDFYAKNNVRTMLGETVSAIYADAKQITLQNGTVIDFDKLLVSTGASPVVFPCEGLELVENMRTFCTLDDAKTLLERVNAGTRVFIVGAGLIGLKAAEGLRAITEHITVCDLAPRILSSVLSETPAGMIQKHLEANGIRFQLGTSAVKFTKNAATLANGAVVEFDQLVYAAGVRPNAGLVKEAGGAVNRGVVVDANGRTSLPDIYAAGDCTESVDAVTGQQKMMALLPNAYLQGEAAGAHMAGGTFEPTPLIPQNAIGFFGKHILSAGVYPEDISPLEEIDSTGYRAFYYDKERQRLLGFILIDGERRAGIYTALVRERTTIAPDAFAHILQNPGLIVLDPATRAGVLRKKVTA